MMRRGSRVVSSVSTPLSAAKRMTLWNQIQRADSETARVLARELPVEEQLRASVARNRKEVMTTEPVLARVEPTQLAPMIPESKFELLRDTYAKGATPQEFELFVSVCNRLRLDPFNRQIYAIKRWDSQLRREVMQPQVSIDGMRLVAERSGKYAGQSAPEWCGADGLWKDVWLANKPPMAARVSVYRSGFVQPVTAIALYSEYVQRNKDGEPTKFWATMPANQLAKCAESLALRKAFPNELSGVYSVDEMGQAETAEPAPRTVTATVTQPAPQAPPAAAKPKSAPPPPPPAAVAKPAQQQMQEQVDGPRFSAAFPIRAWADKPMRIAPIETLADYIAYCEGVLSDNRRATHHKRAAASKAQAEAIYQEAAALEMHRVVDHEETTQRIEPDAINAGLQAEYDRMHRAQANLQDETDSWVNR